MIAGKADRQMYDNIFGKYSAEERLILTLLEAIREVMAGRLILTLGALKVALDYTEELRAEKGVKNSGKARNDGKAGCR